VSTLGDDREFLHLATEHNAQRLSEIVLAVNLHHRHATDALDISAVALTLEPPTRRAAWRSPVALTFPLVRWTQGNACIAFGPPLGIEVVAPSAEDLERMLAAHVRAALVRTKAAQSLGALARVQRCREVSVEGLTVPAKRKTPKQLAIQWEEKKDSDESVLKEVGTDLTQESLSKRSRWTTWLAGWRRHWRAGSRGVSCSLVRRAWARPRRCVSWVPAQDHGRRQRRSGRRAETAGRRHVRLRHVGAALLKLCREAAKSAPSCTSATWSS
jgi:hypothetical protein